MRRRRTRWDMERMIRKETTTRERVRMIRLRKGRNRGMGRGGVLHSEVCVGVVCF